MSKSIRILLIEDSPGDTRLIREMLAEVTGIQFDLNWADDLSTGLERLAEGGIDAVLLDLSLPDSQGIDTFTKLHSQAPQVPIVVMTGLDDELLAARAVREGAQDYLVKGRVDSNLLNRTIRYAIERKRGEDALRESERRFRELADLLPQAVFETDAKGNFTFVSRYGVESNGYTQDDIDRGLNAIQIFAPEDRDRAMENMERTLNGQELGGVEYTAQRKDGSTYPVILYSTSIIRDGKPLGIRGIVIDITERKRMESELLKVQKLESIGIFAGGIAHDFNNLLTAILGNISLAKLFTDPKHKIFERLVEAEKASARAQNLTQQLLTFSKGGAPIVKTATITELLKDSAAFALRGSNVTCKFSVPDDLWPVEVDEGQVSQVISNLVINAEQAMPEGGIIIVYAENITLEMKHGIPLSPGDFVEISVQDHGIGIPGNHLQRIFDPYFTTKQKGSGLGLATSYSIIKNHNGHITVESQVGKGTTFHIYLPAFPEKIPAYEKERKYKHAVSRGRILVMDDEEMVRETISEMLRIIGCKVTAVADGAEATETYQRAKESGHPFDAVIMDLTVPGGMSGKEAVQKLMEIDPEVNAIATSGYSNDPVIANYRDYGFSDVIPKPYRIEQLSEKMYKALNP